MRKITLTAIACLGLLCAGAGLAAPKPNPTLLCQQSKLEAQGDLQVCLAANSADMLKGAPDHSAECQERLTRELARIDAVAAREGTACRYVANGDGTVSDLNTALMWEQQTSTCSGEVTCYTNTYTWSTGDDLADGTAFTSFLATLNNGASVDGGVSTAITGCFANHCDWRLPSIVELQGILLSPYPCSINPCIDPTFGPTQSNDYWSATTLAGYPYYAWFVTFSDGFVIDINKAYSLYVRAVRSGL